VSGDVPIVECAAMSRVFPLGPQEVRAVDGVTCAIRRSARIALTGTSGSGKSTLLHLFAGLDRPTSGSLRWPALGDQALRPGPVAMIFQAPSLIAPLNVIENVELPLLLLGVDRAAARADAFDALSRLGLTSLATRLPEDISGGQEQRVAVARALVAVPMLIVADEPTAQLDTQNARAVVRALLDVARSTGAALVVATHDERIAADLDVQWHMSDGRLTTGAASR
jgi:ABC-type lipoprotein export system ATPase subunit